MRRKKRFLETPLPWVVALVVIAAGIAVMNAGGDDAPPIEEETASVDVDGPSLPPYAFPDGAIGLPAPTVSSRSLTDTPITVGPDGTARLIGFFAHWCSHCQAEVPQARAWLEQIPLPSGVDVVAVSTAVSTDRDNYPPSAWFDREDWPTPVVLDDQDGTIARAFGLTSFPYWVAVGADGTIVARVSGSIDESGFRVLLAAIDPAGQAPT